MLLGATNADLAQLSKEQRERALTLKPTFPG